MKPGTNLSVVESSLLAGVLSRRSLHSQLQDTTEIVTTLTTRVYRETVNACIVIDMYCGCSILQITVVSLSQ